MRYNRMILFCLPLLFSLFTSTKNKTEKNLIRKLLASDTSAVVKEVATNPEKYRLQIVFTELHKEQNNQVYFKTHTYRTDLNEYFYPASMVKLPVAALTLEKINQLKLTSTIPFENLNLKITDPTTNASRKSNMNEDIMKMLVMSNNPSFNNLYDFLGQEPINKRLWEMGYKDSRVIQKFANLDTIGHRTSPPVEIFSNDSTILYQRGLVVNTQSWKNTAELTKVGRSYVEGKKIINQPKDFSYSNFIPLKDLHEMLISIIYPEHVEKQNRFLLTDKDYALLKRYMGMYPREANVEEWKDETVFYDSFRKYLLVGNSKNRIDSCLRIYNKVGQAYGFMTDCAYIKDDANDIEFFLSATLYTNKNEVINDGKYEYNSIGMPFLEKLGKLFYNYELSKRKKSLK